MIVVDASILATALADDGPAGRTARAQLAAADGVSAPDLVDVETVAVFRKRWLAGGLTWRRFLSAVDDLGDIAIDRFPTLPLMRRAYQLRANVTPYDATYLALAEGLACPLVTADAHLARAPGLACDVVLIT